MLSVQSLLLRAACCALIPDPCDALAPWRRTLLNPWIVCILS